MFDIFGGEGTRQWTMIIPLIGLIVFSFVMKRRKTETTPQDIASGLLSDLNADQGIMERFGSEVRPIKFKIASWQRNNAKLGFLDDATRSSVSNFFKMAEDFNQQMDTAKRYKTTSYISGINTEKMKEPLAKGREGLQEWMKVNMQQAGPGAGRQGCIPGLGM